VFKSLQLVVFLIVGAASAASAQPPQDLIGTYTVFYRTNAGGCGPFDANPFGYGNPYYCVGLPPGPIHIAAPPGRYRIVRTQVLQPADDAGGVKVWSGDSSGGMQFNPGTPVEFDHRGGEISLYYHDWFTFDNDPGIGSVVEVYSVGSSRLTLRLDRNISAPSQERAGNVPPRPEVVVATAIVEGGSPGDRVEFRGGPVDLRAGGHDHFEPTHGVSGDGFGDFGGLDGPGRSCSLGETAPDACSVTFRVARFGGKYSIEARSADDPPMRDDDEIDVDIKYLVGAPLVDLPPQTTFVLTGSSGANCAGTPITSRHQSNHYATPRFAAQLHNLTELFYVHSDGVRLRLNDTSLPKGGVFDFHNDWASNEHQAHREGVNADIELSGDFDGLCLPLGRELENALARLTLLVTGTPPRLENNRNHFHLNRPAR